MIKRTLYFGNQAYLSTKNEQIKIKFSKNAPEVSVPIEDIGVMILDNSQITITHTLISRLLANNVALITCNEQHHPTGMLLNLDGHTKQSKLFREQISCSEPLKKQIWQQTVIAKIKNQTKLLELCGCEASEKLKNLSTKVLSGDSTNMEAQAASIYWKGLFGKGFTRKRFGDFPNNFLNYGYAILRGIVARSLTGSGMLPTLGIHHRNQYNAYCLADDIMEPYRPFVDLVVLHAIKERQNTNKDELVKEDKEQLLKIPILDVHINNKIRPLMVAAQESTASLALCFEKKSKEIKYPILS